ncbi:methyl-accepting chemotaxis protein [Oceanospirillum maris]|uniref:methyl-accepting chemotaxis protein n=1 Tax=Oceanospirillum maris TaxID=64977 RepID=UPI000408D06F|nr:methyl-accepting chemotaxis protein [Oceanospirillum maris]
MSLKTRLLALTCLTGIIPALLIGGLSLNTSSEALKVSNASQLESIREIKKSAVQRYLHSIENQVMAIAENPFVAVNAAQLSIAFTFVAGNLDDNELSRIRQQLKQSYQTGFMVELERQVSGEQPPLVESLVQPLSNEELVLQNTYIRNNPNPLGQKDKLIRADTGSRYDQIHGTVHPYLSKVRQQFEFYDIFLIDPDSGNIVYSVYKEIDFATSLNTGPYSHSGLARAYRAALKNKAGDTPVFIDFSQYLPSYMAPAAFVAQPVFDTNGRIVSVLAIQFPLARLNSIMNERTGMGESGETFLVGSDGLMRSDSALYPEAYSVATSFTKPGMGQVKTVAVERAKQGASGVDLVENFNGDMVLSAFSPLGFKGLDWLILAEIKQSEAFSSVDKQVAFIGSILAVSLLIIVAVALFITRSITRPLGGEPQEMAAIAHRVAHGDLTYSFTEQGHEDSVYASMREMSRQLHGVVGEIATAAHEQAAASGQLSQVAAATSQLIHHQHDSTSQVATAVQEMTASVGEVTGNTVSAANSSQHAKDELSHCVNDVGSAVQEMQNVVVSLNSTREKIEQLDQHAHDISQVVSTIREIADQTNLLALNAAIEAARAGEQGRGFAVVADEVRVLAQSTSRETAQISAIVETLQIMSDEALHVMGDSVTQAEQVSNRATLTVSRLEKVAQTVTDVNGMMLQVASASEEQNAVADDINQNVAKIHTLSNQTGTSIKEISSASDALARSAELLKKLTQQFRV